MGNEHQTDTQTNRHVNSMTDSAERAESVKIKSNILISFAPNMPQIFEIVSEAANGENDSITKIYQISAKAFSVVNAEDPANGTLRKMQCYNFLKFFNCCKTPSLSKTKNTTKAEIADNAKKKNRQCSKYI